MTVETKRARRVGAFAAKLAAETFRAEPATTINPTDDTIATMLAECVRPPTPDMYDEIRVAYANSRDGAA